jgi:hypothetical protein
MECPSCEKGCGNGMKVISAEQFSEYDLDEKAVVILLERENLVKIQRLENYIPDRVKE